MFCSEEVSFHVGEEECKLGLDKNFYKKKKKKNWKLSEVLSFQPRFEYVVSLMGSSHVRLDKKIHLFFWGGGGRVETDAFLLKHAPKIEFHTFGLEFA